VLRLARRRGSQRTGQEKLNKIALCLFMLLTALWSGEAGALDPARELSQFKHRRWTFEDGAPAGIRSIVQAGDGYLLLGTGDGLYRFDGVAFEYLPRPGNALGNNDVGSLLVRSSGEVWISYDSGPIGIYRNGSVVDLPGEQPVGLAIEASEDEAGDVWYGLYDGDAFLARYSKGKWQYFGDESGLNPEAVYDIVPAKDGVLWVMTAHTLQYLRKNETQFQPTGEFFPRGAALTKDAQGVLWISDNYRGTRRLPDYLGGAAAPAKPQGALPVVEQAIRKITVDRDGAIWGVTKSRGIFRIPEPFRNGGTTSIRDEQVFGYKDGLTSDIAEAVYEDREGNIWVGTTTGLDQFRSSHIVIEPSVPRQSYFGYTLFNGDDGTLYVAASTSLHVIDGAAAPRVLTSGFVHPETLCEGDDKAIYLTMSDDMLRLKGKALTHVPLLPEHVDFEGCARDGKGALWFTLGAKGAMRLDGQGWEKFPLPTDRPGEWGGAIQATPQGIIAYFSTTGLVQIDTQPWKVVATEKDIAVGQIAVLYQSPDGLLIGGRYGLARLRDGKIDRVMSRDPSWLETVQGITQTSRGDTWLLGSRGLVRVSTKSLNAAFATPGAPLDFDRFDSNDGLPGPVGAVGSVRDILGVGPDGRIWLATTESLGWLDPAQLARNDLPPPVHITRLVADDQSHASPHDVRLKEGTTSFQISYTALSLSIPERVRFRYRLDGVDRDWVEAGARREAFYTKLSPGDYRFHVMASNNDGVWNEAGATLAFAVPPTFLQSPLFVCVLVLLGVLSLWALYTLRVRQVSLQMRRRLEERLSERERIARELHDTLLQGFQGLVLRFQAATQSIPANLNARGMMEAALDQADSVIVEGRDRVRDLRSTSNGGDLAEALSEAATKLVPESIRTTIREEGGALELHPTVFEEMLRIGEEAVANAARHSGASAIIIELAYQSQLLRMTIRDNGVGVDPKIIEAGRAGHFGLLGMRERAQRIRAQFSILSRPSAGAEVTLTVPAAIAYKTARASFWLAFFKRLSSTGQAK